jgi:hypothetical protein
MFLGVLGLEAEDAEWLRDAVLEAARTKDAVETETDAFGTRWRIDVELSRRDERAMVRTVWIVRSDEDAPRFVTCWIVDG